MEADGSELLNEMRIPNASSLFLTIYVLEELEDVILGVPCSSLDVLRKFHVDVFFDWSLGICHYEVYLMKGSMEYDAKHDYKPNCKPRHNRCAGFIVVHAVDLFSSM